jgi:hypothetical protein
MQDEKLHPKHRYQKTFIGKVQVAALGVKIKNSFNG